MAPSVTETVTQVTENLKQKPVADLKTPALPTLETGHREPLKLSGVLDQFKQFDVTPVIGREFADVDLAEWLRAPNSDELLRDLAITSMTLQSSSSPSAQAVFSLTRLPSLSTRRRLLPQAGQHYQ